MSWLTRIVWVESVDYDRAVAVLQDRRPMDHWDAFAFRCWVETGWDQRPPGELGTQLPVDEVPCYDVRDDDLEAMGVAPAEIGHRHVVFLCHPLKEAVVCSTARLYVPEEDEI